MTDQCLWASLPSHTANTQLLPSASMESMFSSCNWTLTDIAKYEIPNTTVECQRKLLKATEHQREGKDSQSIIDRRLTGPFPTCTSGGELDSAGEKMCIIRAQCPECTTGQTGVER